MPLPTVPETYNDANLQPFHHASEFEAKQPKADSDRWLVPNLIPHDGTVILASSPKRGKTLFAAAIARAIASGGTFLGHQLEKAPILWCAFEETPSERMPSLKGIPLEDPFYIAFKPQLDFLDDDVHGIVVRSRDGFVPFRTIYKRAREVKAHLVVIDCLNAAVHFTDLSNNFEARRLITAIRDNSHAVGCATLVLHHLTKSAHRGYHPERFADSAQILAASSTHFFLDSWQDEPHGPFRIRLHGFGRTPAPPRVQEITSPDEGTYHYWTPEEEPEEKVDNKAAPAESELREFLLDGMDQSAKEIAAGIGRSADYVRKLVAKMPDMIRRWDRQEKTYFYSLLSQKELHEEQDRATGTKTHLEQSPGPKGTTWKSLTPPLVIPSKPKGEEPPEQDCVEPNP